jgi:hypothetical protein
MTTKRIDWQVVREARARLAELARQHPELTGPSNPENVAAWEDVLRADEEGATMSPNTNPKVMDERFALRLPAELLERLDAYLDQVKRESGGRPGRSDIIRTALETYLDSKMKGSRKSR